MSWEIQNQVQAYLNDHLDREVRYIVRDIEKEDRKTIGSFLYDHEVTASILIICISLALVLCTLMLVFFISSRMSIYEQEQKARICVETGFDCKSNTKNTDIQYHDTPLINLEGKE